MTNQSEQEGVDELQDVQQTEGDESTNWKAEHAKLVEKAIKARERNKALKDNYKKLESELESLKKAQTTQPPTKDESKTESNVLLERLEKVSLRQAGITHPDDIDFARVTAKKWGMDIDELVLDDDFKTKLERQQRNRSNLEATANIRGGGQPSQAKQTPEYWIAKGTPPTKEDVSDRKTRAKIIRAMMESVRTGGKKFYND